MIRQLECSKLYNILQTISSGKHTSIDPAVADSLAEEGYAKIISQEDYNKNNFSSDRIKEVQKRMQKKLDEKKEHKKELEAKRDKHFSKRHRAWLYIKNFGDDGIRNEKKELGDLESKISDDNNKAIDKESNEIKRLRLNAVNLDNFISYGNGYMKLNRDGQNLMETIEPRLKAISANSLKLLSEPMSLCINAKVSCNNCTFSSMSLSMPAMITAAA